MSYRHNLSISALFRVFNLHCGKRIGVFRTTGCINRMSKKAHGKQRLFNARITSARKRKVEIFSFCVELFHRFSRLLIVVKIFISGSSRLAANGFERVGKCGEFCCDCSLAQLFNCIKSTSRGTLVLSNFNCHSSLCLCHFL